MIVDKKMIKFLDLEKVNNRFRKEIEERITSILDKGWYLQGDIKNTSKYRGKYGLGTWTTNY